VTNAGAAIATLELADWRRQIADLYADVRRTAATDPAAAHALWRATRQRLFREHSQSPVPPADRPTFRASHFDYDPSLRFEVTVEPDAAAADPHAEAPPAGGAFGLPMSVGGTMSFRRIGHVSIPFAGGPRRLGLFWMAGYAGGLFLPFRDGTSGRETYGAGRYLLDAAKAADLGAGSEPGTLVLDFNFAFQPSCAFDPRWACPLAPPENRLDLEIRAGERLG
jgi:uncharacterized protein (DUF1684 family)